MAESLHTTRRHALVPDHVWRSNITPRPQIRQVLSQIGGFLNELGYVTTLRALQQEADHNGVNMDVEWYKGKYGGVDLRDMWVKIWENARSNAVGMPPEEDDGEDAMESDSESSSSDESNAEGAAAVTTNDEELESDNSDSDSDSGSAASPRPGEKRKREATPDSSDSSSSDSDSDSNAVKDEAAAAKKSGGESESDSSSDESDNRPLKRAKVSKSNKSNSSSGESDSNKASAKSSSSSSSESDSDSDSSSDSASAGSDSSSDSSSSDSDSESGSSHSPPPQPKRGSKTKKVKPHTFSSLQGPNVAGTGSPSSSSATLEAASPVQTRPKDLKSSDTLAVHVGNAVTKYVPATKENVKKLKKDQVSFSRIPADTNVDPKFASNAYVPYDYADRAYRDLSVTKGKGFTKEKNKKKRGAYRGGAIDLAPKAIKFED